jgi:tetratricopeptide (TPR) repeat protein
LGMFDMAEAAFNEVAKRNPDDPSGYRELSRLYVRTKRNLPQARKFAQKVVDMEPVAPAYYDLALACFVNQDLDTAIAAMNKAIQLDSRDPRYPKMLALFKQKKGAVE